MKGMSKALPSPEDLFAIAAQTVESFPDVFRTPAQAVVIRVEDFIPPDMLDDGEDEWDITGLYTGVPMTLKRPDDIPQGPDTVWLFRMPILDELSDRAGETLEALVSHVTVHEFAHHFGWSDADIARIDPWWE